MSDEHIDECFVKVFGLEEKYEVSNYGRVRSITRIVHRIDGTTMPVEGKILAKHTDKGYERVNLVGYDGKTSGKRVHRIVLESFTREKPDGMDVCHINGNKLDNRLANLRWGTRKDNEADKVKHGTFLRGEKGPGAKLKQKDVDAIRKMEGVAKHKEIAALYGVSRQTIHKVLSGETWKGPDHE